MFASCKKLESTWQTFTYTSTTGVVSFIMLTSVLLITYKKELLCGQGGVMSSPVIVCLPYVHKSQLFTVTTLSIADKKSNPRFSAFQKFNSYTKTCYHQ